jgi:hypothetical protein
LAYSGRREKVVFIFDQLKAIIDNLATTDSAAMTNTATKKTVALRAA